MEGRLGRQSAPTARFVDLLERAGFREVGVIDVTPVTSWCTAPNDK